MVFVFSLEDEISFQTVYNYFLRLCSFRNASEVPMVLVGTQGERPPTPGRRATGPCFLRWFHRVASWGQVWREAGHWVPVLTGL